MPWSFNNQAFDIAADNPIFDEWFPVRTLVTVDAVKDSSLSYVDIGATIYGEMTVMGQWATGIDRDNFIALVGQVATLEDDTSRSCEALLRDATPIRVKAPGSGVVRAALVFIFVAPS